MKALPNLVPGWRARWRPRAAPAACYTLLVPVLLISCVIPSRLRVSGQESDATPSIKVTATSVVVDVIVTDARARYIHGLAANDFRVYENDTPQTIVSFAPPVKPTDAAGSPARFPALESDATHAAQTQTRAQAARQASVGSKNPNVINPPAPAKGLGTKQPGPSIEEAGKLANARFITIVFDVADIQPGNLKRARDAAEKYLKTQVAREDFVAVYRVDSGLHLAQPFTQDKDQAARAVRKIGEHVTKGVLTAQQRIETQEEIDGILRVCAKQQGGCDWRGLETLQNYLWNLSVLQARAVFVALRAIAQTYSETPGRKNVVVFSEGFIHSPDAQAQLSSAIDAANRANVAFYIIDASGLTAPYGAERAGMEITDNEEAFVAALASPGSNKFDWIGRLGKDNVDDDLRQLATGTGGVLVRNQNDLLAGLSRVDEDLREVYTLVYQPTNTNYDGSFRHIRVELAKQRYHLRYRLGYWAIPPGEEMLMSPAAAQLLAGVARGELKPSFAPEVNGTVLIAPDGRLAAPVRVTFPAKEVKFEKDPNRDVYHGGISFLLLARDSAGHIASAHQRFINLAFDSRKLDQFKKQALAIDARMAIPKLEPLELEAILQFADGTIAMGKHELALRRTPTGLQLTGLLLTNRVKAAAGPRDPADPLQGPEFQLEVPGKPHFAPTDKLIAYFGALGVPEDASSRSPHLSLSFRIGQADAVIATLPPEQAVGDVGQALVVLKQIDLSSLGPGKYALQVTAEDSSGQAASQSADFTIVARGAQAAEAGAPGPEDFVLGSDENPGGVIATGEAGLVKASPSASVVNAPLSELAKKAHELKGIMPAAGQGELPLILKKVGANVESFARNFPDTVSTETIRQKVLDSSPSGSAQWPPRNTASTHEFRYLALNDPGAAVARLREFRQDSKGQEVDARMMMSGDLIVTWGFVSLPMLFHPQYQTGSDFRLLGRQTLGEHEAYVIGFAQRDAAAFTGRMRFSGDWISFLMQGVAWVDATTYQILRMKTWLLPGPRRSDRANVTTTVEFSEVHFKHDSVEFWLPRDVVVEVVWSGKMYTNRHHYSDYGLFSVQAGQKAPGS